MTDRVPLSVLATIDPVRRDAVALSTVLDRPRTVVIRHDLDESEGLHRVVIDSDGVVEDVIVPLEHVCMTCAVREDAIPVIDRLSRDSRYDAIMLALPVSADSMPVTRTLSPHTQPGRTLAHIRIASVVAAIDLEMLEDDVLGTDTLIDRGLAYSEEDERAVSEALVAQLAHADLVQVASDPTRFQVASELLDHLRAADGQRLHDGDDLVRLFSGQHDPATGDQRVDPRRVRGRRRRSAHGVWSLSLSTQRAFHPERLMDNAEHLGGARLHSRGIFWVPTRPDSLCAWEGAGGQVSIGDLGPWGSQPPRTELVVTGVGDQEEQIRDAFNDSLLTRSEMSQGLAPWLGREDVLAQWLGDRG